MATQLKPTEIDESSKSHKIQGMRSAPVILVVDDEPAVRRLIEMALQGFDFEVRSAATGQEALEEYRRGGIDLVLMDVQMPVLDGLKTLACLREINPDVVCCFMSAHIGRYEHDEIRSLGANGFLQKPFHLEELRQLVMNAVG